MFNSATALRNYIAQTKGIPSDEMHYIELGGGEKMLVEKSNPSVSLGFATFTYVGIVPGRGKTWDIFARPA